MLKITRKYLSRTFWQGSNLEISPMLTIRWQSVKGILPGKKILQSERLLNPSILTQTSLSLKYDTTLLNSLDKHESLFLYGQRLVLREERVGYLHHWKRWNSNWWYALYHSAVSHSMPIHNPLRLLHYLDSRVGCEEANSSRRTFLKLIWVLHTSGCIWWVCEGYHIYGRIRRFLQSHCNLL